MINIKIRTTNFELTPAIEEYVNKKVSSLERFLNQSGGALCEVELGKTTNHHKSGEIFKAEINIVESRGGKQYFVVEEQADLYSAIDIARDKMEEVIVSKNKKQDSLWRRGASKLKSILKRSR
jgi:ribosomal subunit interface protein